MKYERINVIILYGWLYISVDNWSGVFLRRMFRLIIVWNCSRTALPTLILKLNGFLGNIMVLVIRLLRLLRVLELFLFGFIFSGQCYMSDLGSIWFTSLHMNLTLCGSFDHGSLFFLAYVVCIMLQCGNCSSVARVSQILINNDALSKIICNV